MGLSYNTFNNKEKEEILDMDFTFENWKIKSLELLNNYIERSKNICPRIVWFCFDDIFFVMTIRINKNSEFKLNNFIDFIRDYYIMDDGDGLWDNYRDMENFYDMQKKVIEIYPKLKEKYGKNRILEKFLSYFWEDNDYSIEKVANILDQYYNKDNNKLIGDEEIKLKDK